MITNVIYICAQSVLKLDSCFELSAKGILEASSLNHLVFTAGESKGMDS